MKVERTEQKRLFDVSVTHDRKKITMNFYPILFEKNSMGVIPNAELTPTEARALIKALKSQVARLKRGKS